MVFPGPARDITKLLEEDREKIAAAVISAASSYDKFISRLNIDQINNSGEQKAENMEYFIEMINTYITSGPDKAERKSSMGVFADNWQKPFSEVKEVLDYLGLEI